jgi:uncharacterized protein (DUF1015 family)
MYQAFQLHDKQQKGPTPLATLKPFLILRPDFDKAADVCTLPYDVMNTEEARAMAEGKPDSFLRVTRSEIEFPSDADPYSDAVYEHGADKLRQMIDNGVLVREDSPVYMIYRQVMGEHTQYGIVGAASCREYETGIIKKHELTRPDKEDDRTRHINILGAQTGAVFLTYPAHADIDAIVNEQTSRDADIDFTSEDGIRHTAWMVRDESAINALESAFAKVPALYVADGHHRSAAALRVAKERNADDADPAGIFLTVNFPDNQVQILGYNRAVRDLNGLSADDLLTKIREIAEVSDASAGNEPRQKGEVTMYLDGKWYLLKWKPEVATRGDAVAQLDVSVLQDNILAPALAIGDPRTDKRISFVGGIRGTKELEKLVNSGDYAVAFALYPTSVQDLMEIADQDGLMPPKSTWFEPKLRDAMAVHLID